MHTRTQTGAANQDGPELQRALREARQRLAVLYGERLKRVILFGSQARGEARLDSDVDVLVVLEGPITVYQEIKRLVSLQIDLFEHYGLHVSFKPYDEETEETYNTPWHPLMLNIREEGIAL